MDDITSEAPPVEPDAVEAAEPQTAKPGDTPSAEPTPSEGAAPADVPANPATPPPSAPAAAAARSAPSDTRSAIPPQPNASTPPAMDWEKRYKEANSLIGRQGRELANLRQKVQEWDGLDVQQVRALIQRQQAEAQQQNLKPWHPRHPEAARTEARIHQVRAFVSARDAIQRQNLDPQVKQGLLNELAASSGLTDQDVQLYNEHRNYVADQRAAFDRDPGSFIQEHVDRIVQARLNEYHEYQRAHADTHAWLHDPKHAPLIEKHRDVIAQALDERTPRRDLGMHLASLTAQVEALKAQLGQGREAVEQAKAQSTAINKRATIQRDAVAPPPAKDALDEARDKDLILDHTRLLDHLRRARHAEQSA